MTTSKASRTWVPLTRQSDKEELLEIVRAEGEFVFGPKGERYIDAIASWWTVIFGHRHPVLLEALEKQMSSLDHVMLAGHIHPKIEELSIALLQLSGKKFHKVFYSDNGSNALEIALKLSIQYYKNKSPSQDRTKFLVFSSSYHGDSIGAMNVSGKNYFNRVYADLRFPVEEFPAPNCYQCPLGYKPNACDAECVQPVESALKSHKFAAIVIEPLVFGANGMVFYEAKVLHKLRKFATSSDTLLLFDEVFTGMGRLGSNFAFQKAEVVPDLLALAKGLTGGMLPFGATLVSEKIYESFVTEDPYKSFFHAHTMTGNALAAAVACACIQLWNQIGSSLLITLEERLRAMGRRIQNQFPDSVTDMRVQGGILAFEWKETVAEDEYVNPIGKQIRNSCLQNGILIRPLGRTIYLTPPYTIGDASLRDLEESLVLSLLALD